LYALIRNVKTSGTYRKWCKFFALRFLNDFELVILTFVDMRYIIIHIDEIRFEVT